MGNIHSQNDMASVARPGHFNDPDMLQIGNIGLTLTEQYTHMTLWCIAGAPLLAGTDLVHASNDTLAILANVEVTAIDQRVTVAEFGGGLDFGRERGEFLEREITDHAGVQRSAAADHDDTLQVEEFAGAGANAGQDRGAVQQIQTAPEGVSDRLGLLVDLLEHEMVVAALLHRPGLELQFGDVTVHRRMIQVRDVHGVSGDQGDIPVVQVDDPPRVRDEGRGVGSDQALTFADADDERAAFPGDDDASRFIGRDDRDAVGSLDLT